MILCNGGKLPRRGRSTLGRANQLIREGLEKARAKGPPSDAPPQPDPYREWAEKSLGLRRHK